MNCLRHWGTASGDVHTIPGRAKLSGLTQVESAFDTIPGRNFSCRLPVSFGTYHQSFIYYATTTAIITEDRDKIVAPLRALLPVKMKSALKHSIEMGAFSTLGLTEILDVPYSHIRATRSVAMGLVEFENRV